jgi:IPT/TIG domain
MKKRLTIVMLLLSVILAITILLSPGAKADPVAPTVQTSTAVSVTSTGATLNGNITYNGGEDADTRGFQYRPLGGSWTTWTESSGPYGTGIYSHPITGLAPGTNYEFRATAHNSGGDGYGSAEPFTTVEILTNAATSVTSTSAVLNGNMTNNGGENADQRGFQYKKTTDVFWTAWNEGGSFPAGTFNRPVTGLTQGTEYQYKAQTHNSGGWSEGATITFTTISTPTVATNAAGSITATGATLNGDTTATGGENADQRGFRYRKQGTGTWTESYTTGSFGTGTFNKPVTGLLPNTTYEFEARAHNSAGWADGGVLTFSTLVALPNIITAPATTITSSGATLNGNITDIGGQPCNIRGFSYHDPVLGWLDWHQNGSFGTGPFSHPLTGLAHGRSFQYAAYCGNTAGTVQGSVQTFTTPYDAPVITSLSPGAGPTGTQVTITGTDFGDAPGSVNFNGVPATGIVAWANTSITCIVPDKATSGPVIVNGPAGASTGNFSFEVTTPTWYLAEGSTAWGYDCYLSIENPNDTSVNVRITYMTSTVSIDRGETTLPALSQTTINPRSDLGNVDFSTKVECTDPGKSIAADRTMVWTGQGAKSSEGHCSIGVTGPATTWYLPEGSTDWGFECWLLIQNPGDVDANCTVTYMTEKDGPIVVQHPVSKHTRQTFDVSKDIGSKDASIKVQSDVPVIPERSMYRNNKREGHVSIGTTSPAIDYYLAEGAVGYSSRFTTYVLVQNPQDTTTDVSLTYQTQSGQVAGPSYRMSPNSRKTFKVNDQLPPDTNVSTKVHGSQPIIAERSMYWGAGTVVGEACHDSIGMDSPHTTFYLPDGQTSYGKETWTLIQNPNDSDVTVRIRYLTSAGTGPDWYESIPANSRSTFNMSDKGIAGRASILVTSTDPSKKIMVERSMYWNSRGAGTDTIGGYSD